MADSQPIKSTVEYRDILGFPGYRCGDDGSVWSCRESHGRGGSILGTTWHRLAAPQNRNGYSFVTLYHNGKPFRRRVCRLVLEVFVGPCPPGMVTRHFPDRDPANCRLGNLSWATQKVNLGDTAIHGTRSRGEHRPLAKLTDDMVREIRTRILAGELQIDLACEFGIAKQTISAIAMYKIWRHVI